MSTNIRFHQSLMSVVKSSTTSYSPCLSFRAAPITLGNRPRVARLRLAVTRRLWRSLRVFGSIPLRFAVTCAHPPLVIPSPISTRCLGTGRHAPIPATTTKPTQTSSKLPLISDVLESWYGHHTMDPGVLFDLANIARKSCCIGKGKSGHPCKRPHRSSADDQCGQEVDWTPRLQTETA